MTETAANKIQKQYKNAIKGASKEAERKILEAYPVDTKLTVIKGGRHIRVLSCGECQPPIGYYEASLFVKNPKTGTSYWVDISDIIADSWGDDD